jgi:hypothetical protein
MSFVIAVPETLAAAANDVAGIGSAITAANTAAAAPTTSVVTAAADEVSTQIAALFGAHAQEYQALSARSAGVSRPFLQALNAAGGSYAAADAANATPLAALDAINAPTQALLGRPLIGDGATGGSVGGAGGAALAGINGGNPGHGGDGGSAILFGTGGDGGQGGTGLAGTAGVNPTPTGAEAATGNPGSGNFAQTTGPASAT